MISYLVNLFRHLLVENKAIRTVVATNTRHCVRAMSRVKPKERKKSQAVMDKREQREERDTHRHAISRGVCEEDERRREREKKRGGKSPKVQKSFALFRQRP